jgi:hypothetical protein
MFLSEWREFPSAPYLAKKSDDSSTFIYLLRVSEQSAKENTGPERTE